MVSVVYEAPGSVADAVTLLVNSDITASVLAGGTDLLIQMQSMVNQTRLVVDLKKIPEMMNAILDDEGLQLGPCMQHG